MLDTVKVLETANTLSTSEVNAQEANAACIVTEIQGDLDALEKGTVRQRETITITTTRAEPEQHINAAVHVHEAGRARLEELASKLEEVQYNELAVVGSLIMTVPCELMTEIFDWHMLMGGRMTTTLLVCKRWTMVAYSSPQLWSRITVAYLPFNTRYLRGSILCTDLDYLRLVLSHSQACPLQLEIRFETVNSPFEPTPIPFNGSTSLMHGPQAADNRTEAIKLILGDQILRRCISLDLTNGFLPFNYQNVTVLPLLSSIRVYFIRGIDRELLFIQSLLNLSPALRHVRCNLSLGSEVGPWTRTIDTYLWIYPYEPCPPLHGSPSLRRLGVIGGVAVPLTLPALQVLRWSIDISNYSALHRITAPQLHTLILRHPSPVKQEAVGSISFPNLRVAIHTSVHVPMALRMFHTPALEHLSIEYRSSAPSPTALLELFDGWTHMPTPKSLHLDCTFTDTTLITVLGRLPWLEELQIGGTGVLDTFWEGLTPSCNPSRQVTLPDENADENATHILIPNLKVLLVNYPTRMQDSETAQVSQDPNDGRDWTVIQASAVAAAREQAGCPLITLACWSSRQKVEVLLGSLDGLHKRPKSVSLTALWC